MHYIKSQLSNAFSGSNLKIKIVNEESNDTNWLNLDKESIAILIAQLELYKETLTCT